MGRTVSATAAWHYESGEKIERGRCEEDLHLGILSLDTSNTASGLDRCVGHLRLSASHKGTSVCHHRAQQQCYKPL